MGQHKLLTMVGLSALLAVVGCGETEPLAVRQDPLKTRAETENPESDSGGQGIRFIMAGKLKQQVGLENSRAATEGTAEADGLCIRSPIGPGWVNWTMSNPASWGYSVKPESSGSLVWARSPGQDLDALYNRAWGCGVALKVADSCTATVGSGYIECCCNAAAAEFGHICQWVPTASHGFPSCPL